MSHAESFEEAFFGSMRRSNERTAFISPKRPSFTSSGLKFEKTKLHNPKLSIREQITAKKYLLLNRQAFDLSALFEDLTADNDASVLRFSENYVDYEPEPGLVKLSKVPLWVVSPTSATQVAINRVW